MKFNNHDWDFLTFLHILYQKNHQFYQYKNFKWLYLCFNHLSVQIYFNFWVNWFLVQNLHKFRDFSQFFGFNFLKSELIALLMPKSYKPFLKKSLKYKNTLTCLIKWIIWFNHQNRSCFTSEWNNLGMCDSIYYINNISLCFISHWLFVW